MIGKLLVAATATCFLALFTLPEVKVAGALSNIMVDGDLSAHISFDTLNKTSLYGLGPAVGLKGEVVILDGKVYTSEKVGSGLENQQNTVNSAAMLVYSNVKEWKEVIVIDTVQSYAELEKLVSQTAAKNNLDMKKPFPFRVKSIAQKTAYHVIDWKKEVEHTMDNHKQFAYVDSFQNKELEFLGFYSTRHKSVFTHHTTNMHIHFLEKASKTVGHLDNVQIGGAMSIFLPRQ
jgi:acetolactate decarboxylase